jgi:hypothetical protein
MVAVALLAGMEVDSHMTVSRRWAGCSHRVYSTRIGDVTVYRLSRASLARVYLETLNRIPDETLLYGPRAGKEA